MGPEVWVLCQCGLRRDETKYFLVDLPGTASLRALVQLGHQRWAIEPQYTELKTELGLNDW